MSHQAQVAIIGAGPVGLCLALDLAWRGIHVTVLEQRPAGQPPSVKCNHIASRTMEAFRRLGFVERIRAAGLPDDYPNDVTLRTRATGYELTRIHIPCRRTRYTDKSGPDGRWPTPEPAHRINQIYFEPILYAEAAARERIVLLNDCRVEQIDQDAHCARLLARNLRNGESIAITADYVVGCDGGPSLTRKAIGARLHGDQQVQRVQSSFIRAPGLIDAVTKPDAWMSYLYAPERAGNLVAIDGRELWLIHNYLLPGEPDFEAVDRDACIRLLLGVDASFHYELLTKEDWVGRRLVADKLRERRVFICGDAAHLWVPYAGYGMNAGIADAFNLSWQVLAAHGFVVIAANPRGSSGRGQEFSKAIFAAWGEKDTEDVLAVVDYAVAQGVADANRLGVGGWSYGGILTDNLIARDRRFKAAVSGASSGNALAGYGTDMYVREWELELGVPWKNLDTYVRNSYPFLHADRIITPTLFMCGERDFNVPLLNSEQMYQAVRSVGVDTQLVIYPGQFHALSVPSYLRDRLQRQIDWYQRHLSAPPRPTTHSPVRPAEVLTVARPPAS